MADKQYKYTPDKYAIKPPTPEQADQMLSELNGREPDTRPAIQINARHHREISEDAYQALLASNDPPRVFVRSGRLARIKLDEDGRPVAEEMGAECLKYELDRAANFFAQRRGNGKDPIDTKATIQMAVVKDVMAYPQWPELPPLGSIVQYPTFCPDGSLHTETGYNPMTRIYYYKNGLTVGELDYFGNTQWAKDLILNDLLVDFPFVDEASRTHAVASLLLPFVRPLIRGPVPLHLLDAPQFGTGKGKLVHAISAPSAPNGIALITAPDNDEEWRKLIISTLMTAPSHILIDNIPEKLQSGVLAAVLTANSYTARLLGTLTNVTAPNQAVWLGTGNNTSAHGELARRIIWTRLDANMEEPWKRTDFKHPNLEQWTRDNRADLVRAALILIKNWFYADCPTSPKPMGSFDQWAAIMGGILEVNGFDDFLGNADEMYNRANADRLPWAEFVETWYEKFGHKTVGAKDLFPIASYRDDNEADDLDLLGQFIDASKERGRLVQFGRLLRENDNKVFAEHKIVGVGTKKRLAQYKLQPTKTLL